MNSLQSRFFSELFGTAALLLIVVGSGIMGEQLAAGNAAVALLANSLATGLGLLVLIHLLAPISGAHFNPVVSLLETFRKKLTLPELGISLAAQAGGALLGVWTAHFIFERPLFQVSQKLRPGLPLGVSEWVATLGLLSTIHFSTRNSPEKTPLLVAAYITSAYWFTASTSFANPAVTFARMFTDTFAGIAPTSAPVFIIAQFAALLTAVALYLTGVFRRD